MIDPNNEIPPLPSGFELEHEADHAPAPMPVPASVNSPAAPQAATPPPPTGFALEPAPITDTGMTRGFADEAPPEASKQLSAEDTAEFYRMLRGVGRPRANADELRQFVSNKGLSLSNAQQIVDARDKGGQVVGSIYYPLHTDGPSSTAGTIGRGAVRGVTLGFDDEIHGAAAGAKALLTGGNVGDAYHETVDADRGQAAADFNQHPYADIGAQLIGGLAIPIGLEKAGLTATYEATALSAGRAALREGVSLADARIIAQRAVTRRLVSDGAIYGGVHGVGNSDGGVGSAISGGLTGAAGGALTGGLLGKAGEFAAPILASRAVDARLAPPPTDYADLASRLGITPTPATIGGPLAETAQMGFVNVPGGVSAVANAVDRENTGLADAAHTTASSVGNVSTRQGAGEAVATGAADYERSSRDQATSLYGARDQAFGGKNAPVSLDQTRQAYSDIASGFPTSPAMAQLNEHPVLRSLASTLPGSGPITLQEATDALSHVRGVERNLASTNNASGAVLSRVSKIEQALEDDVMSAGRNADAMAGRPPGAPGSAVKAQQDADAFYADRKAALNGSLKPARLSAVDPVAVSGEAVYNRMLGDTQRVGGNYARLSDAWSRLPAQAKSTFAATAMDDLGRALPSGQNDAGNVWSFNTFLTNYNKMTPEARSLMFGSKADGQLQDIAAYASRLRDIGKSRNYSNTAKSLISGAVLMAVGRAFWHGDLVSAGEAAGSVPAAYFGAKLFLATPAMRRWTGSALKLATTEDDPVASRAAGAALTARLSNIAKADPSIAQDALGLQRYLRDALAQSPGKAAAADNIPDGGQEPPQQSRQRDRPQPPPSSAPPMSGGAILQNLQ